MASTTSEVRDGRDSTGCSTGGSAVVPTAIAERAFLPDAHEERRLDRRRTYAQAEEYV
jgi:hypothetical protein